VKRILKHLLWIIPLIIVIGIVSLVAYAATARNSDGRYHSKLSKTLQVSSDSFQHEQEMSADFSCRGRGMAPHLQWAGSPNGTRSYAVVAMDWDAPSPSLRLFPVVHWILYNIPVDTNEIPQNSTNASLSQRRIVSGLNIGGQQGYMPPCPPLGTHRYEFRVYALDVNEIHPSSIGKAALMTAMDGHILAYGELVGLRSP
jgi:Raf kinase inhibitor-like YbhB/YbcL family protein